MEIIKDKKLFKIVSQPLGGGKIELYGEHIDDAGFLQRTADQSVINCGKHIMGGGFNPNHRRELLEVYGDGE